jgi:hypothetical protein
MPFPADNRPIRRLIEDVREKRLIPRPEFQRRLVWNNKDKNRFIETVLKGYPFPEIYIAAGEVDLDTGAGIELLVDGQQRITTLTEYFTAGQSFKLETGIEPYASLTAEAKKLFLDYPVAVRYLGNLSIGEIKEIFRRINSTSYSLNEMEVNNAIYQGEFRQCAQQIADEEFFQKHGIFNSREMRRMADVSYVITLMISMMESYPNRDDQHEEYLKTYNEAFADASAIRNRAAKTLNFIEKLELPAKSRAWKKADFLVLFTELDRLLGQKAAALPKAVSKRLNDFYSKVDQRSKSDKPSLDSNVEEYFKTTLQATNDRHNRIQRAKAVRSCLVARVIGRRV